MRGKSVIFSGSLWGATLLLAVLPSGVSAPDETPPISFPASNGIRLDRLADDETLLFIRIRVEPWFELWRTSPVRTVFRKQDLKLSSAFLDRIDPRARVIFQLFDRPGIAQAGLAVWAPNLDLGFPKPVWMMGFKFDLKTPVVPFVEDLIEHSGIARERLRRRTFAGTILWTLAYPGNHLHVAADRHGLVLSTDLALLQEYLESLKEIGSGGIDWPENDAVILWNPPPSLPEDSGPAWILKTALAGFNVRQVKITLGILSEGLEISTAFRRSVEMEVPDWQAPDPGLLAAAPEEAQIFLLGGGIRDTTESSGLFPLFGRPFAAGIGIPSSTSADTEIRFAGVYRSATPLPDTASGKLLKPSERESVFLDVPDSATLEVGGLQLRIARQGDWVRFWSTEGLLGGEWIDEAHEMSLGMDTDQAPVAAGIVMPEALLLPLRNGLQVQENVTGIPGETVLRFVEPDLKPVRFAVHLFPSGPEIRMKSASPVSLAVCYGISFYAASTFLATGSRGLLDLARAAVPRKEPMRSKK